MGENLNCSGALAKPAEKCNFLNKIETFVVASLKKLSCEHMNEFQRFFIPKEV